MLIFTKLYKEKSMALYYNVFWFDQSRTKYRTGHRTSFRLHSCFPNLMISQKLPNDTRNDRRTPLRDGNERIGEYWSFKSRGYHEIHFWKIIIILFSCSWIFITICVKITGMFLLLDSPKLSKLLRSPNQYFPPFFSINNNFEN